MTPQPQERPQLLSVLQGDRAMWQLISTWPNMPKQPEWTEDWHQTPEGKARIIAVWSRLSDVSQTEIKKRCWRVLFGNGFLAYDGTVDRAADQYVGHAMMSGAPAAMRRANARAQREAARRVKAEAAKQAKAEGEGR